jgi:hypothetical protein
VESPGQEGTDQRRRWIYAELIRCEQHWTDQLQNQQTRINTTLTVNGIMLAFVAGTGLITNNSVSHDFVLGSISALALGVIVGVFALKPSTKIEQRNYLSSDWLRCAVNHLSEDCVLDSLIASIDTSDMSSRLRWRRALLIGQLVAIGIGTFLLVFAVDKSHLAH